MEPKKGQMELMRWWVLGHTSPLIGAFLVVPCSQWCSSQQGTIIGNAMTQKDS